MAKRIGIRLTWYGVPCSNPRYTRTDAENLVQQIKQDANREKVIVSDAGIRYSIVDGYVKGNERQGTIVYVAEKIPEMPVEITW